MGECNAALSPIFHLFPGIPPRFSCKGTEKYAFPPHPGYFLHALFPYSGKVSAQTFGGCCRKNTADRSKDSRKPCRPAEGCRQQQDLLRIHTATAAAPGRNLPDKNHCNACLSTRNCRSASRRYTGSGKNSRPKKGLSLLLP